MCINLGALYIVDVSVVITVIEYETFEEWTGEKVTGTRGRVRRSGRQYTAVRTGK